MKNRSSFLLFSLVIFTSCVNNNYSPVPRAYFKFHFPDKDYEKVKFQDYFLFEKPAYSSFNYLNKRSFDLEFKDFNATLHFSYYPLRNDLLAHVNYAEYLAYQHDFIADAISEKIYINNQKQVFGLLYDYDGATATSTQFYLTDSTTHFVRGALYFNFEVTDSISPINNFLKDDVHYIIESFVWGEGLF